MTDPHDTTEDERPSDDGALEPSAAADEPPASSDEPAVASEPAIEPGADDATDAVSEPGADESIEAAVEPAADDATDAVSEPGADDLPLPELDAGEALADAADPSAPPTTMPTGDVTRAHLKGLLEVLVFVAEKPLTLAELAKAAKADRKLVRALLDELKGEYASRGIRLDEVAGGFVFRTSAAYAPFVRDAVAKKPVRMTRTQLETLAIVAYRQPITRPEIDDIRGVDSGPVLKMLLERDLVRILGKKDEPGRPLLYGTTPAFLELFGLKSLKDMPTLREFTELSDDSRRVLDRELPDDGLPTEPLAPALPREAYEDPAPGEAAPGAETAGEVTVVEVDVVAEFEVTAEVAVVADADAAEAGEPEGEAELAETEDEDEADLAEAEDEGEAELAEAEDDGEVPPTDPGTRDDQSSAGSE